MYLGSLNGRPVERSAVVAIGPRWFTTASSMKHMLRSCRPLESACRARVRGWGEGWYAVALVQALGERACTRCTTPRGAGGGRCGAQGNGMG
eukprot:4659759-Prymnesium_polylepis.1